MSRRVLVLAALLGGCATGGAPGAAVGGGPDDDCATGSVAVQGVENMTTTVLRTGGGVVPLSGAEAARVRQLSNALVTVCGVRAASGDALEVRSFELRQVDGMPAFLGRVRTVGDQTVLDPGAGRAPVPLADVPDALAGAGDGPVWVAGSWRDGRFAVASYGVLSGG